MSGLPSFRVSALRRHEHFAGLLGAWNFNEGAGTTARDSSGNGRHLTVDAALTWPAGHSAATAIANTGVTAGARVAWNVLGSPTTLMGWARPTDLTAGTNRPLFGVWDSTDTSGATQLALWAQRGNFSTPDVLQGNVRIGGGLVGINHTALTLNTWVHLALTFDGATIRLYRNGVEVSTVANSGAIGGGTFSFLVAPDTQAQVDDVRIFNSALTASQIVALMGNPVAPM